MLAFSGSDCLAASITGEGASFGDSTDTDRVNGVGGSGIEGGSLCTNGFLIKPPSSAISGPGGVGVDAESGDSMSPKPSPACADPSSRGVWGGEGDGVSFVDEVFDGVLA